MRDVRIEGEVSARATSVFRSRREGSMQTTKCIHFTRLCRAPPGGTHRMDRSRTYLKNDEACIEQKNHAMVPPLVRRASSAMERWCVNASHSARPANCSLYFRPRTTRGAQCRASRSRKVRSSHAPRNTMTNILVKVRRVPSGCVSRGAAILKAIGVSTTTTSLKCSQRRTRHDG